MSGNGDHRDHSLDALLDAHPEDAATLGLGQGSAAPSPGLRSRLLSSLQATPRYERFAAGVAQLLDLPVEHARRLLGHVDDPAVWSADLPGMSFFWLPHGPAREGCVCGFVRLDATAEHAPHEHLGQERVLILQGYVVDSRDGRRFGPGDLIENPPDSVHALTPDPDGVDALHLVVTDIGYRAGPMEIRPRPPTPLPE